MLSMFILCSLFSFQTRWVPSMFIFCSFFSFQNSAEHVCKWCIENDKVMNGSKSWSNLLISFVSKDVFSSGPVQRISREVNIVLVTGEITEQYMGFMEFPFHSLFYDYLILVQGSGGHLQQVEQNCFRSWN